MKWRYEAQVEASPDAVFAWMSDFRPDDHSREAFVRGARAKGAASHREVISREGNRIKLRDTWGRSVMDMDVELVPGTREVRLAGQWGYRSVWRAEASGTATRIVVEGAMEPTGVMRLFAPLFARGMAKQMRADFDGHVEDMRGELTHKSSSGRPVSRESPP